MDAIELYRQRFRASQFLTHPHVMLAVNMVIAETGEEARRLFTSHQQAFVNLRRGTPGPLPPPDTQFLESLSAQERWEIDQTLAVSIVGSPDHAQSALEAFIGRTHADELIFATQVYDHAARLRSYELASSLRQQIEMRVS
jgi:alkanesulfonate monooxygenase SsuD/methylene tetrahydromethanopterin reductase-like flavin-dependent oxidoreductase (luciferase family)